MSRLTSDWNPIQYFAGGSRRRAEACAWSGRGSSSIHIRLGREEVRVVSHERTRSTWPITIQSPRPGVIGRSAASWDSARELDSHQRPMRPLSLLYAVRCYTQFVFRR